MMKKIFTLALVVLASASFNVATAAKKNKKNTKKVAAVQPVGACAHEEGKETEHEGR